MACGVPVVSTTGGALPEVVGNAGIVVPPADSDALAKAIKTVLDNPDMARDNPDMARTLAAAGYKRVQENFTWKRAAKKTVEAYREAISDYRRF